MLALILLKVKAKELPVLLMRFDLHLGNPRCSAFAELAKGVVALREHEASRHVDLIAINYRFCLFYLICPWGRASWLLLHGLLLGLLKNTNIGRLSLSLYPA